MLRSLWQQRALAARLAASDLKSRTAGSALGAVWIFLPPAVTLLVYVFVFSVGFKSAPVQGVPYAVWLFAGMTPWFLFSDALSGIVGCVTGYAPLVKKTRFQAALLPFVKALSALAVHGVFLLLLYSCAAAFGVAVRPGWLLVPFYSLCALFLALGLGTLCAALAPYVKDLPNAVALVLQLWFWATPIAYSAGVMSPAIQAVLRLNPLAFVVEGCRACLFGGPLPWERPLALALFLLLCSALYLFAARLFARLQPCFSDVL